MRFSPPLACDNTLLQIIGFSAVCYIVLCDHELSELERKLKMTCQALTNHTETEKLKQGIVCHFMFHLCIKKIMKRFFEKFFPSFPMWQCLASDYWFLCSLLHHVM